MSGDPIGEGLAGIARAFTLYFRGRAEEERARKEMKRAAREQKAHEEMIDRQMAAWQQAVDEQRAHGDAGDASEREAIAALGGRGPASDGGFF
ncbi:MAG: hypothetical protein AB7F35_25425 [Acetobacteraceae bacterium]|uniref:hypothetical protein n=1 Tax=Bradyrhizobium sp. TaxID=376 RepID=UPI003D127294